MIAMTEVTTPFISLDLNSATFDETSDTYDVTNSVHGVYHDIFLIMQKYLNFSATFRKRKDGKWGPTTVLENGTVLTEGIVESLTSGFGEMIVSW